MFVVEGPDLIEIEQGGKAVAVYRVVTNGLPQLNVCLVISGLPVGVTATFQPSTGRAPFDSILTLDSAADSEAGECTLNITAWDIEESKTMPIVLDNHPVIAPPNLATIVTNSSSYAADATITVTVNGGLGGIQEWVGLWVSSNADLTFSYLSNWKYLNGTQATTGVPTYPTVLTFTAPSDAGTYNMRYFAYNGVSNRLAISANFTVSPAFTADYYASPTGSGANPGTLASPFRISDFWAHAAPGVSLGLVSGTYTGANQMIVPTTTLNGASGNPIRIRALTDGAVKIDGEDTYQPCYLNNNDWFRIEGINFVRGKNTSWPGGRECSCVRLFDSHFNFFSRCGAWDAYDDGATNLADPTIWSISSSSDNIFEDCFGFGVGRYVFYTINTTGVCENNKLRRFWARYDQAISIYSSPRGTMLPDYTGNETILLENCILECNASASNVPSGFDAFQICLEGAGLNNADPTDLTGRVTIRGCLFFVGPSSQSYAAGTANGIHLWANSKHTDINNLTVCIDPANSAFGKGVTAIAPNATFDGQLTNVITIGTNADSINSGWSPSNVNHYSTTAACPNPYAFLTYRWIGGVMDLNEPHMWPWPMRQRIIDATTSSSWPVADVHADVEAILGTLPS